MSRESDKGRTDSVSTVIKASPKTIYEAYIDPEALVIWLPPEGMTGQIEKYEAYEGGAYRFTLTYNDKDIQEGKTTEDTDVIEGKFLELVPYNIIVQSGRFMSDDPSYAGEIIQKLIIEDVFEGTKVTFIIENVPEGISKEDHDAGLRSTLENLARYVGGAP